MQSKIFAILLASILGQYPVQMPKNHVDPIIEFPSERFYQYDQNAMPEKKTVIFFVIQTPLKDYPELKECYIVYDKKNRNVAIISDFDNKSAGKLNGNITVAIQQKLAQKINFKSVIPAFYREEETTVISTYKTKVIPIADFYKQMQDIFGNKIKSIQVQGIYISPGTFQAIRENLAPYPEIVFKNPK